MFAYILRRVLTSIPLLFLLATLLFILIHLVPGDPSDLHIGDRFSPEYVEQIKKNMGLDQPVIVQYGKWLRNVAIFDFGESFANSRTVSSLVLEALPNTLLLSTISMVLIFSLGVLMGVVSAVRQYHPSDFILTLVSLFLYSMPSFWLALMMILLSAHFMPSWPLSGMVGEEVIGKMAAIQEAKEFGETLTIHLSNWEILLDRARHLVMPAFALGIAGAAGVARFTRSSMLEIIRQDFIRTARAKGVPGRIVIMKHALRNGLIPVITLLGLYLPFLVSGAVLIESIFAWPGMGRLIVTAINQRDYPVIMATSLLLAFLVVVGNLLADILYAVVDPRIRYD